MTLETYVRATRKVIDQYMMERYKIKLKNDLQRKNWVAQDWTLYCIAKSFGVKVKYRFRW